MSSPAASQAEGARGGAEVVVDHLTKSYPGGIHALDDVSLRVSAGEALAITGPSGCGKSTLLNIVGTLERPDSGSVTVGGVSLADLRDTAAYRRDTVGFIFQLHHLLPVLTARANVELPLIAAGLARTERRLRALELLGEVGLADRADERPAALSGGERQRVAVARAIANEPRVLLADEPTGSLDSDSGRLVMDLLDRARARRGMTLLVASHDPAMDRHAARVLRMVDGRIVREERSEIGGSSVSTPGPERR